LKGKEMHYTLVTDASYCPETGVATGAAVYLDSEGKQSKTYVWKLDAEDSYDAELQTLVMGIKLIPKEANLTAFTDVEAYGLQYRLIKDEHKVKQKQRKRMKPLMKALKGRKHRTEVMWAGCFGEDHQLLSVVHKAAYRKMKEVRKSIVGV
jgi:ribonuclease HI